MKLSVALITYNHERFIRRALESVLAQRVNFEYEIVVGEDCSTDGTRKIVAELYQENPDRIVPLLRDQNMGGTPNLISTLCACRGEYVALLEGDDYWICPDKLQRQVDFLDQHPDYSLCCHRVQIRDETGAGRVGVFPGPDFKAGSFAIEDLFAENFIPTCSVMYRSDSCGTLPDGFVDVIPGDWARHILSARSGKIQLMDDVMAVYRMQSAGLWTSKRPLDQTLLLIQMMCNLDRHLHFQYTDLIGRSCAGWYFDLAIAERLNGNRMATAKYLCASLCSGRLQLTGRWRALAALLVYCILGIRRSHPAFSGANK